ncbi:hypothetical protein QFC20_005401 [Naganishia adeliensis]|uniref:Uncharacterized protein n=1 Tax=Naganishia adeliensis TaxID=92952 RepID=A0ACC2VNG7_9TREE|nr:hypothetical protein QFC20_005401 [Naganishia adeliensis]
MSAFLDSSSEIIGDYMLRGWTMTDRTCVHCHITPLMRQPLREVEAEAQRVEFCATCQGGPNQPAHEPVSNGINAGVNGINGHLRTVSDSTSFDDDEFDIQPLENARDMDLSFELPSASRTDAPRAADTSIPNNRNPAFAERDAQSARASGLIGNMLLRGFSLLADSCPKSTCYGIPLVGHPRARRTGGGRDAGLEDMKKECVICHRVYNKDGALLQGGSAERVGHPAPVLPTPVAQGRVATANGSREPDSPRTTARRALYTEGEKIQTEVKSSKERLEVVSAPRDQPSSRAAIPGHTTASQETPRALPAVADTIEVLVATLSKLNTELRTMLEQPDVKRTIKDKGMKRCLNRIRDTMETLAAAEELQLKLQK